MRLKKGDQVLVIAGKDKGKTGKIEKVLVKDNKVIVTGINILKKHSKPSKKIRQGGIIDFPAPIDSSNVVIVCPKCSRPTKIKKKLIGKSKERICAKCKEVI